MFFCKFRRRVLFMLERIMTKLSELPAALEAVSTHLDKVTTEVTGLKTEFQEFKDQVANQDLSPEAQAALDKVTARVQALDELNEDKPEVPSEPTEG